MTVEMGKEKVQTAFSSYYQRAAGVINVPGFRKGKAPPHLIANFIGKEKVQEEISEELVSEGVRTVLKERNLLPISEIKLEDAKIQDDGGFIFKISFELKPKLPEFKYRGRDIHIKKAIITDESIDNVLNNLAHQFAKTIPVENTELGVGDYFLADIDVNCEGQHDDETSEKNAYRKLTDKTPFLKPLLGMKVNETRKLTREVKSESEKNSKFFGKTLEYTFKLNGISRSKIPEINDSFAKELGAYNSLDELKTKIRSELEEKAQSDAEIRAVNNIFKTISEEIKIDAPDSMVQRTIDSYIQEIDYRWKQYGASLDDYLKKSNIDIKDYRASLRDKAVYDTKVYFILREIIELEKIEISDSEFMKIVEEIAAEKNMTVQKVLDSLDDFGGEDHLKHSQLAKKVNEFLLSNNQINYDMVSEAELKEGEPHCDTSTDSN
ncbi:MAG: trigger factor [Candidatus Riflebacteria bacterium]|nr:trigger factor [Candidatus Riflebacteria bacterium]